MAQTPKEYLRRGPSFARFSKLMLRPPRVAWAAPIEKNRETRAPGFIDLTPRAFSYEGRRLFQAREAGGARPQSGAQTIAAANKSAGGSTSLLTAGKAGFRIAEAKGSRKTIGTTRSGEACEELLAPDTIRADLLSSITSSWLCKSSVMEITKNRMTRVQPIAIVFRQWLRGRSPGLAARNSTMNCTTIPTIATQTQTRLSASSMLKNNRMRLPVQAQGASQLIS